MNLSDASIAVNAPLTVRPYTEGDREAWTAFVDASPEATFFHRIEWRSVMEEVFRHRTHYLVAKRGAQLAGILPLAEVRSRLFGHSLVSLPFAVYGGAAAEDEESRKALHGAAADVAAGLRVDHLELRNRRLTEPGWPRQELYVSFRKEIAPEVESNLTAIPRKQRAMVRKAMARGLASEVDDDTDRFFDLYADNMHRHGTPPFSRRYFDALRTAFGSACEILTVVDAGRRPVSSVMSFYFRDEVLPYYAGDVSEARDLAANDFKYWELMRRACERGYRVFDYGRSKRDSGSYFFKKNWGFNAEQLHYEYRLLNHATVPQNNPANPKYRAMITVWRKLPRPIVNKIGPMIVRALG